LRNSARWTLQEKRLSFLFWVKTGINYPLFNFVYSGGENHRGFLKYNMFYELSVTAGKALVAWIVFFISLYLSGFNFWLVSFSFAGLWSILFLSKFFYKKVLVEV